MNKILQMHQAKYRKGVVFCATNTLWRWIILKYWFDSRFRKDIFSYFDLRNALFLLISEIAISIHKDAVSIKGTHSNMEWIVFLRTFQDSSAFSNISIIFDVILLVNI